MRELSIAILALLPTHSFAQVTCAPREVVVPLLQENYGERQWASGINATGSAVFELYANEANGTWTLIATTSAGVSCLIGSGNAFQISDVPLTGQEG